jgi:hypothetical protein
MLFMVATRGATFAQSNHSVTCILQRVICCDVPTSCGTYDKSHQKPRTNLATTFREDESLEGKRQRKDCRNGLPLVTTSLLFESCVDSLQLLDRDNNLGSE